MNKSENFYFVDALVSRLLVEDEEYASLLEELYRMQAGIAGEEKLQRVLADFHFKEDVKIFYNFECLNRNGFSHQIDALIITSRFLLIFEVKQISGTLFYKPKFHEFSRQTDDGVIENFPNPFDQAYRHQLFLSHLLENWGINLPVLYIVVNANVRTKLDASLKSSPIIHLSGVPMFLKKLYQNYNEQPVDLNRLENKLKALSCRLPPRRRVDRSRLRKGVLCEKCNFQNTMHYHNGVWVCGHCNEKSKDAIFLALHQYRILINKRITNREFRDFFGIESRLVTSKLLNRLDLHQFGTGRGVYYIIPENILGNRRG